MKHLSHSLKFIVDEMRFERLSVAPCFAHAHHVGVHNVDRERIGDAAVLLSDARNMSLKHFDERFSILGRDLNITGYADTWVGFVHLIVLD